MDKEKKKDYDFLKDPADMTFEEFQAGPGKLVEALSKDMQDLAEPAERLARSVHAMSDARGFQALVSMCMELIWLRRRLGAIPRVGHEFGPKAGLIYAKLVLCTWRTLGESVPSIDVDEVLKKKKDKEA